jgi:transposase InsO family protein
VHRGDQDGLKGTYHINAVDIVTQWELVAAVERISEAYLLPVIALLLEGFPFAIRGFHSDSGSEYVNHDVAKLLDKLRVEFTKSRPRQTNDNALAECKNGAIIRKLMGDSHIPQQYAAAINRFYAEALNPYLNFHRPCCFAVDKIDAKGKIRKTYPQNQIWRRLAVAATSGSGAGRESAATSFVEVPAPRNASSITRRRGSFINAFVLV